MADDGLTLEAWSMPHVGALTKKFNFTKYVVDATFNDRFNDLSDGAIVLADDFPLKDELFKIDEANHANDAGSMVRVLRGATPIMHYLVTRSEDTWSDQDPVQKVTVEGLEWLLDRATVPHYDYPADPTVEPDWIYGADSVLTNTAFEASGVTSETVQLVVIATAGTFKIGVDYPVGAGFVYTGNIAWNVGAADIAIALEALTDIDDAFVTGAGTEANPFIIEVLAPASVDMGWATDSALLTGTASIVTATSGGTLSTDPWTRSMNPITGVFHGSYTTFEISTTQAHSGTYSLKVDGDPPAAPGAFPGAQQLLSVTPGRTFRASVWVYPTQTASFRLVIRTRDETYIASENTVLTANSWQQISIPTVTIPLWVNQIIFRISTTSNSDEPAFYVDDALFAPGQAAATLGKMMGDVRTAAVAQGVLTWLTPTWTTTVDSDGVAWDSARKWNVNHDQTFLQLLEYARRWNYESRIRWDVADNRFEWDMWNPSGGGQTRPDIAITGKSGVSSSGPIVRRPPDYTYMRVEGEEGRWGDYTSTTLDDVWGRLEKAQVDRQGVESAELDQLAQRLVTRGQDKTASRSVQLEDPSILPWTAYEPGDIVYLNLAPKDTRKQLRIAAIAVTMGGTRSTPLYEVHFVSPVLSENAALVQGVRNLIREFNRPRGSVSMGRETVVNPVELPAPTPLSGDKAVAQVILAAIDSTPEAKGRADIVCDGTNDDLVFATAIATINITGGAVVCLAGHYYFGSTVTVPELMGTLSIRGEPGAILVHTGSIATGGALTTRRLFVVTGQSSGPFVSNMMFELTGFIFDGDNVAVSSTIEIGNLATKPVLYIHKNIFLRHKGFFIFAERGEGKLFAIVNNHFSDSTGMGPEQSIRISTGFAHYQLLIADNGFKNISNAQDKLISVALTGGTAVVTNNHAVDCPATFVSDNGSREAIYHNWYNNVYLAGDHTGVTGVVDATAIHDNVAAEISAITEKTVPVAADLVIIEDSAAANVKKRVQLGNLPIVLAGHDHTTTAGQGGVLTNDEHDGFIEATEIASPSTPAANKVRVYAKDDAGTAKLYYKTDAGTEVGPLGAPGSGTDPDAIHDNVASEISAITTKTTPVDGDFLLIEDSAASNVKKKITIGSLPGGSAGDTAWHEIGAGGEPAFANSWVNFGAPYETAAFRKNGDGLVHLKGLIKDGTATPVTVFTLSTGYRPAADLIFLGASATNGSVARVDVKSSGAVTVEGYGSGGSNAWVSLSAISFYIA